MPKKILISKDVDDLLATMTRENRRGVQEKAVALLMSRGIPMEVVVARILEATKAMAEKETSQPVVDIIKAVELAMASMNEENHRDTLDKSAARLISAGVSVDEVFSRVLVATRAFDTEQRFSKIHARSRIPEHWPFGNAPTWMTDTGELHGGSEQ